MSYTTDLEGDGSDDWHIARRYTLDLGKGGPATVADIVGDKNAEYVLQKGAKLFTQTLDSVLASSDVRASRRPPPSAISSSIRPASRS